MTTKLKNRGESAGQTFAALRGRKNGGGDFRFGFGGDASATGVSKRIGGGRLGRIDYGKQGFLKRILA
jgi:hypothetical protein